MYIDMMNMADLIRSFPDQLKEALAIASGVTWRANKQQFAQVVISGLGGSGIGATIVQDYTSGKLPIPLVVNKDYSIPQWVSEETLFIACSYSGNTEETLQAAELARKRKATLICICSGGKLEEWGMRYQLPVIKIPSGYPPRACLGYSIVQLLFVLKYAGLLKGSVEKEIKEAIAFLEKQTKTIQKTAEKLAASMKSKIIAIYTTSGHEGLAIRFRQQINENAKSLSWHHVIPEMTHNEIVGWRNTQDNVQVVFFYAPDDFGRNLIRLKFLRKVVSSFNDSCIDIVLKGDSTWERNLYFIHLTDWISLFLSRLNGFDAVEVKVIDRLKSALSKK